MVPCNPNKRLSAAERDWSPALVHRILSASFFSAYHHICVRCYRSWKCLFRKFQHLDKATVYPVKISIVIFPKWIVAHERRSLWTLAATGSMEERNILYLLWARNSQRYFRQFSSMQTTHSQFLLQIMWLTFSLDSIRIFAALAMLSYSLSKSGWFYVFITIKNR